MNVGNITGAAASSAVVRTIAGHDGGAFDAAWQTVAADRDIADEAPVEAQIAAAHAAIAAFDLTRPATAGNAADYGEAARQVSIAQGLPGGSHDFTRITPRQMAIVGSAMVAAGTVRPAGLAGALDLMASQPEADTPVNLFAFLNHEATANEKTPGGMALAFQQRASTAVLTRVQSAQGVPIVYDDNYPTAPRVPTAEEANARLKAAITAFRKEAAMTPAQRVRRDVLKEMNLSEDALKAMPQAERDAAEKKIGDEVARRLAARGLSAAGGRSAADDRSGAEAPSLAAA